MTASSQYKFSSAAPGSVYYPSCVVNAEIRLDEGVTALLPGPQNSAQVAASTAPISPTTTSQTGTPLYNAKGGDNLTYKISVVPRMATIELPGLVQAGTFELEFAWKDFPLDPRLVRAMSVFIHLDTVKESDFADGMVQTPNPQQGRATLSSVLVPSPQNLVMVGTADGQKTHYHKNGHSVTFRGRDLRGLFLDAKIAAGTLQKIDPTQSIDQLIQGLVNKFWPQGSTAQPIQVLPAPAAWWPDNTVPSPQKLATTPREAKNAAGQGTQSSMQGDSAATSFWDVIVRYCKLCGAIPQFVGQQLYVVPAQSIFDVRQAIANQQAQQTLGYSSAGMPVQSPFAKQKPRNLKSPIVAKPETLYYRAMVFGRNIDDLTFERKLGGQTVPAVLVTSYDSSRPGKQKTLTAYYPKEADPNYTGPVSNTAKPGLTSKVGSGGQTQQNDIIPVRVHGINDKKQLAQIAYAVYQQIGRQELGGSCSTKNLASFGGDNADPDLLRLRPGDPVNFRVDASDLTTYPPIVSELNQNYRNANSGQLSNAIMARIGKDNKTLADLVAKMQLGSIFAMESTFRTNNVKFGWNIADGITVDFDFQNYVEARFTPGASGSMTVSQSQQNIQAGVAAIPGGG